MKLFVSKSYWIPNKTGLCIMAGSEILFGVTALFCMTFASKAKVYSNKDPDLDAVLRWFDVFYSLFGISHLTQFFEATALIADFCNVSK